MELIKCLICFCTVVMGCLLFSAILLDLISDEIKNIKKHGGIKMFKWFKSKTQDRLRELEEAINGVPRMSGMGWLDSIGNINYILSDKVGLKKRIERLETEISDLRKYLALEYKHIAEEKKLVQVNKKKK